jgi:hypothetical protein
MTEAEAVHTPGFDIRDESARRRVSPGAFRTWVNVANAWGLTDKQAATLIGVPTSTYRRWKGAPDKVSLDAPQLERLSLLLGIYKDLEILLPSPEAADNWVSRPNRNPLFNGKTPLDRMLGGYTQDLIAVRRHLDAERGG